MYYIKLENGAYLDEIHSDGFTTAYEKEMTSNHHNTFKSAENFINNLPNWIDEKLIIVYEK